MGVSDQESRVCRFLSSRLLAVAQPLVIAQRLVIVLRLVVVERLVVRMLGVRMNRARHLVRLTDSQLGPEPL